MIGAAPSMSARPRSCAEPSTPLKFISVANAGWGNRVGWLLTAAAIGEARPLLDERGLRDAKKINSVFPPDVVSYYLYC